MYCRMGKIDAAETFMFICLFVCLALVWLGLVWWASLLVLFLIFPDSSLFNAKQNLGLSYFLKKSDI